MNACFYCAGPIEASDRVDHQVLGWERKAIDPQRKRGSDIQAREHTGEVAHARCVDRAKAGINVRQESLL